MYIHGARLENHKNFKNNSYTSFLFPVCHYYYGAARVVTNPYLEKAVNAGEQNPCLPKHISGEFSFWVWMSLPNIFGVFVINMLFSPFLRGYLS